MPPSSAPVLLIVDALALIHRAFHAIPPLQTKDGRVVNAAYGFLSILIKTMQEVRPRYIAVAFDRAAPTFRHQAYEAYKATRAEKPQDLYDQIPVVEGLLATLHIPVLAKDGFEADDVIATLCEKTKQVKGLLRVILTGDQDTLQLVGPGTVVLTPGRGIKETIRYDEEKVRERFGLAPTQLVDYKALRGDPSDNIPGVRGIGEVGASRLIKEFGSLADLYAELEKDSAKAKKIPAGQRKALTDYKQDALQALSLVPLVRDVPFPFSLEEAAVRAPDREEIVAALSALDFKSLLPRVEQAFGMGETAAPTVQARGKTPPTPSLSKRGLGGVQIVSTDAQLVALAKELGEQEKVALRAFYDGHFLDGKATGIAFAWEGAAYTVPGTRAVLEKLRHALEDPGLGKLCHNAKSDIGILGTFGIRLNGVAFDTMLASYVLNPGSRAHELEALVFSELGRELPKVQSSLLGDVAGERHAAEARGVWELAALLERRLTDEGLMHIFTRFELPLAPVLSAMERHGIALDGPFLKKFNATLVKRLTALEQEIQKRAGGDLNVNSAQQLAEVLFDRLKIHEKVRVKKTATGARLSTAAGELEKLKDAHPIVPAILEYRELAKLHSTYGDALPRLVRPDTGRVHTTWNQAVTATGRLSSSEPNLQNIPVRTELGREMRRAFVAAPGRELLVADYSQFELRILAHLANDPTMTDAFRSGEDIHARTASEVWGVAIGAVTKEQRYAAKAINFGIAYGMGANALAESAGIPREEARAFIEKYFLTFGNVREYLTNTKALAAAQGYVETFFGRRRYLPELKSNIPYLRAAGERMAINAPIQGTNADAIKLAMIDLHRWIGEHYGYGSDAPVKMLLQVHDELVFEIEKGLAAKVASTIKKKMEGAISLRVPVVVECRIGRSWGELEKFEDEHED